MILMRFFTAKRAGVALTLLIVAVTWLGTAWAQDTGVFGSGGSAASEGPFEFDLDGGIKVVFQGITQGDGIFYVAFIVTSPEDTVFKISGNGRIAYDNVGNEYNFQSYNGLWIGNKSTSERLIIGGVPTGFSFKFDRGKSKLADVY